MEMVAMQESGLCQEERVVKVLGLDVGRDGIRKPREALQHWRVRRLPCGAYPLRIPHLWHLAGRRGGAEYKVLDLGRGDLGICSAELHDWKPGSRDAGNGNCS
jgi:hypothetical protein